MDNVTIPPEVVEAAENEFLKDCHHGRATAWPAAIRAALAACPEAWIAPSLDNGRDCLALPIQQEKPNHE